VTYASPLSQPCRTGQHGHCHHGPCTCSCHLGARMTDGEPVNGYGLPKDGGRPGNLRRHQVVDRLNRSVEELDQLAAFLVTLAESQNIDPMRMQYTDGRPAMADLVVAQAQALAALAQLEAAP
jgi:hypothetical protein